MEYSILNMFQLGYVKAFCTSSQDPIVWANILLVIYVDIILVAEVILKLSICQLVNLPKSDIWFKYSSLYWLLYHWLSLTTSVTFLSCLISLQMYIHSFPLFYPHIHDNETNKHNRLLCSKSKDDTLSIHVLDRFAILFSSV